MLMGLMDQFVPFVQNGSKTHSVRGGFRWKVGMRVDLYAKPRQRGMWLIFRAPVKRVERIEIFSYEAIQCGRGPISPLQANHVLNASRGPNGESLVVLVDGAMLSPDECRSFFHRDGFREVGVCEQYQALQFWRDRLPFCGQIVHWDYKLAVRPPAALCTLGKQLHAPEGGWVRA